MYVASSWRNPHYQQAMKVIRGCAAAAGAGEEPDFGVYDFRDEVNYFQWSHIDPNWESWTLEEYKEAMHHPLADRGYEHDIDALDKATACLLIGPCGRSAHLELGYAAGRQIKTAIFLPEPQEPELMYRMADEVITDWARLAMWVHGVMSPRPVARGAV